MSTDKVHSEVPAPSSGVLSEIVVPGFPLHIVDTNQTPNVVVDTTIHDLTFSNVLPTGAAASPASIPAP